MAAHYPLSTAHFLHEYPQLRALAPQPAFTQHAGFSGAKVWRVETETGPVAVRQWPAGWSRSRLVGLHALIAFLHHRGVTFVAAPLRSRSGATLVEVNGSLIQIEPWLPGEPDDHESPNRTRLEAAMTALAAWHQQARHFIAAEDCRNWFASSDAAASPAVLERRARIQRLNAPTICLWSTTAQEQIPAMADVVRRLTDLILKHAAAVQSLLDLSAGVLVPVQPVLRDVWRDHVLFTGNEVTGLIDPSACRTESVAADLARLLGSYCGNDAAAWDVALAAYQRHRPLSLAEQSLIPVLDRSGVLLAGVTWLEWLGPAQRFTANHPCALERIREIINRMEAWSPH